MHADSHQTMVDYYRPEVSKRVRVNVLVDTPVALIQVSFTPCLARIPNNVAAGVDRLCQVTPIMLERRIGAACSVTRYRGTIGPSIQIITVAFCQSRAGLKFCRT